MRPRVLFISGREIDYIRNRVLLNALKVYFDVDIFTVNTHSILSRTIGGLARFLARQPRYDVCFVGFYGQPIAIALSVLQHKPIILDAYVSTLDTLCEERRWFRSHSLLGRLAYWLDRRSCYVVTSVITDTKSHAQYFAETFDILPNKFFTIYVGCDETLFYPRDELSTSSQPCEVFYYGSFLPLHGTEVIVQAAALLRDHTNIRFTLGGYGPRYWAIQQMIRELGLNNIELVGWIPLERLPEYIARASICLGGHFSTIPKAARVISTKTFRFIAMRKPTIVGDNSATRELFVPGKHVYAVPMGDPTGLSEAIWHLSKDKELRDHIASGGYAVFREQLTISAIAYQMALVVEETLRDGAV